MFCVFYFVFLFVLPTTSGGSSRSIMIALQSYEIYSIHTNDIAKYTDFIFALKL